MCDPRTLVCSHRVHFCCEFSLTLQDSVVSLLCIAVSSQWPISQAEWPIGPYSIQFATIVSFAPPQDPIVPSQCAILSFPVPYYVTVTPYFAVMPPITVSRCSRYPLLPPQCAICHFWVPFCHHISPLHTFVQLSSALFSHLNVLRCRLSTIFYHNSSPLCCRRAVFCHHSSLLWHNTALLCQRCARVFNTQLRHHRTLWDHYRVASLHCPIGSQCTLAPIKSFILSFQCAIV